MRKRSGKAQVIDLDTRRDVNEVAFDVISRTIELTEGAPVKKKKNPAAVALGRRGGLKGGKARAAKLSPEEKRASALKAVRARWAKHKPTPTPS